mgnify:CR=1 FL=1|jgi:hypothetical protein
MFNPFEEFYTRLFVSTAPKVTLFLISLPLVLTVVIYFMARKDEKRTGESTLSGKSAIIFTSINSVAWFAFIGFTMMLLAFVLPENHEGNREWMPFRLGLVLFVVSTSAIIFLGRVWKNWAKNILGEAGSFFPKRNMFVKAYSGLNVLYLLFTVFFLVVLILSFLVEISFNELIIELLDEGFDTLFKIAFMSLISASFFLVLNFWVYSRTTDQVVLLDGKIPLKE